LLYLLRSVECFVGFLELSAKPTSHSNTQGIKAKTSSKGW
jgi:hypothetical protein